MTMATKDECVQSGRVAALIVGMFLLAVACGASDDTTDGAIEPEVLTEAEDNVAPDSSGNESADESTSTDGEEGPTPAELPDLTGLRVVTTHALGGLRLGVAPDVAVLHEGELVEIRPPDGSGKIIIARVSLVNTGGRVTTVDQFLDAAKNSGPVAGEPTGDTLNVLGFELDEYTFRADADRGNPRMFPSSFRGTGSNMAWGPLPIADLYLAEADGGVLAAGVVTDDETALPALHRLLEDVTSTLSLTGPTLMPVPNSTPQGFTPFGVPDPVSPRNVADGLDQPFSPIEPGTYDLANLATSTMVTVDDGWFVAPNSPGFVALADLTAGLAGGPGDHAVVFLHGVTGLHALGPLRADVIEPASLQTPEEWDEFLAAPPPGLVITNVISEGTIGDQDAIQFDVEIDPDATCQDDAPCTFAFSPPNNDSVTFIQSGYLNRFSWIADAPNGGLLISAHAPANNTEWIDGRAADLLATTQIE